MIGLRFVLLVILIYTAQYISLGLDIASQPFFFVRRLRLAKAFSSTFPLESFSHMVFIDYLS